MLLVSHHQECAMNAFYEHHHNNIRFGYRCFDRILLNGLIQPFQQPERVVGFFSTYRNQYPVSRDVLRGIADQFHNWVKNRSEKWGAPVLDAPQGRRDEFVEPYCREGQGRPVGGHPKGTRTSPHSHCNREQKRQSLAPATGSALGHSVQLLCQRSPLGPNVRSPLALLPFFCTSLSQPDSLARPAHAATEHRLSANHQRFSSLP